MSVAYTPADESTSQDLILACQCGRQTLPSVIRGHTTQITKMGMVAKMGMVTCQWPRRLLATMNLKRNTVCDVILSATEWHHSTPMHAACALSHSAKAIRDVRST